MYTVTHADTLTDDKVEETGYFALVDKIRILIFFFFCGSPSKMSC